MNKYFMSGAVTVLVGCALFVTFLVGRRELGLSAPAQLGVVAADNRVPDWREYAADGHAMGPSDAPVTITTFSDFQCPACRALAASLDTLRARYPREVRVVYRHFPLDGHPYAREAAQASECAAAQGRFPEFHDALFAAQDQIGRRPFPRFAESAGLDVRSFVACADSASRISLASDTEMARRLGVRATPTLLINGTRTEGAIPTSMLESYVQRELRAGR